MAAKDIFHDAVRRALEKEGWLITISSQVPHILFHQISNIRTNDIQYFSVKGERGKGKGLNLPFPLCPLTFSQTKREIVRLIRKVLKRHIHLCSIKIIFIDIPVNSSLNTGKI
ncbi:element excision factor XisH family protein [Nostoc sp. DedSLP03]|uniref:element excision factor XisH family protein n=1 Tax=Nostoc sp. DedSLP03 TaxID=3075400 RepID=UPI003A10077A